MSEPYVPPPPPPPSLGRELRAIVALYAVLAILPLLVGWLFGPR